MTTSLFDEPPSIASFQEYPSNKPFINSNVKRSGMPVKAYPENSSEAVLSALKGLQDKIKNLELDRSKAEKNLKVLTAETSAYKSLLHRQPSPAPPHLDPPYSVSPDIRVEGATIQIESQLRNADARCELLERQLDNMRRMVQSAERERSDALERQIALERDRGRITAENRSIQSKMEKMEFIQERFDDLSSRKDKSAARIRELEDRLKEEEHRRRLLADQAAKLQTEVERDRILNIDQVEKPARKVASGKKKKRQAANKNIKKTHPGSSKQAPKTSGPVPRRSRPVPHTSGQPHYRLHLADVPFIAGTSTSPSHAVSANMQKLLHDLKQHNPVYCNDRIVGAGSDSEEEGKHRGRARVKRRSTEDDLKDLLTALQDEFGKMMFEHQVLAKQLAETFDEEIKAELQAELDALIAKMERKGEQISTVRRHIAQVTEMGRRPRSSAAPARSCSAPRVASVRIGTRFAHSASPRNRPPVERERKLAFLRDMRAIRSALHQDDLSWE